MKVVHITTSAHGGAGIAALRLHTALREQGVASAFISQNLTLNFDGKQIDDPILRYEKPSLFKRMIRKIKRTLFPTEADRLGVRFNALEPQLRCEIATLPFSNTRLEDHPLIKEATLVNLHWVGQILDYPRFFSKIHKPIVWTLHDMNPFKGMFHYELDEWNNSEAQELDLRLKRIKSEAIARIEKGALVSPSKWMLNAALESGVFGHFNLKQTIANSIDTQLYASVDRKQARRNLNLVDSEVVLLFTAAQLDNTRKGSQLLQNALEQLDVDVSLITLGKGVVKIANKRVKIIPLGYMSNDREIANCFAAADAFLLPSKEDNLPNTMLESVAAGTPVIAFSTGGMQEHISSGFNGVLVPEMSAEALANAITDVYEQHLNFDRNAIMAYAEQHFNSKRQSEQYLELYNKLQTQTEPYQPST